MISKFFIDRPVFSMVLSLLIILAGAVSIAVLPIAQFPEIVPPSVQVRATYPGANAETVAQSVAAPIEQQLSGAKRMIYYSSQAANDGTMTLTATFEIGTDQDLAAVDVQNRLSIATPRLPSEVVRQGIPVTKTSTNMVCVIALNSDDPQYDEVYLSNYATINLLDALKRIPGAGDVQVFGAKDYAMRIWIDPDKLAQKNLTVADVAAVIREQNAVFPAGRIGQRPSDGPTVLTIPVLTRGRFDQPADYENIIIRANPDGSMLRVRDVARVELGSLSYDLFGRLDGRPTTLMLVYLQTGANAINLFDRIKETMTEAERSFPAGVNWDIPYETVTFIEVSIEEVIKTLLEAVVLVLAVVFIFLQNWRATLIPLLAVPVSIIGAFAGMMALGFSINTLTMFGLVLAIGIVVDDAIVVVENVERIMAEEHLGVREATIKAMEEVTGPVIAIVLVLCAVFLPVAFLGGLTGELYRQFAVTIAISVAISGLVALTLSPALCRLLLKPHDAKKGIVQRVLDAAIFRWFNLIFDAITRGYTFGVKLAIKGAIATVLLFGGLLYITYDLFGRVPSGFLPNEDQGYIICVSILPDGASLDRTDKVVRDIEQWMLSQPEVEHTVSLGGLDLFAGSTNSTSAAVTFARLKPWSERTGKGQGALDLVGRAWGQFGRRTDAAIITINPPAIQGLGQRAGFEFQLQARSGQSLTELAAAMAQFTDAASKRPELAGINTTLRVMSPQLYVELDRDRAKSSGVAITDVFDAMQAYLGSLYVNDFDKFGRVWRVQMQAEPRFRKTPEDLAKIYVRNSMGDRVPLSGLINTSMRTGPNLAPRFNGFYAVQVTGEPGRGFGTGDAMKAIREIEAELPPGYAVEWSGASYQEVQAGNAAPVAIGFGILVVFLVLAAQYEKWSLPIVVLLAVPLGVLGALVAVYWRGIDRDIYFQVGLLTLVGLAAKNAILIVEFCVILRKQGKGIVESAVQASRMRFRPILMTSLAFILGVLPLVLATGAGAAGRNSIGTGIMGGMIAATVLAIFFVPVFYVLVQWVSEKLSGGRPAGAGPGGVPGGVPGGGSSGGHAADAHGGAVGGGVTAMGAVGTGPAAP